LSFSLEIPVATIIKKAIQMDGLLFMVARLRRKVNTQFVLKHSQIQTNPELQLEDSPI